MRIYIITAIHVDPIQRHKINMAVKDSKEDIEKHFLGLIERLKDLGWIEKESNMVVSDQAKSTEATYSAFCIMEHSEDRLSSKKLRVEAWEV